MSVLWLAVLALGVAPSEATSASASTPAVLDQATATPRQGIELSKAVDESLRHWAKATDADAAEAARELLVLYGELKVDQKMARVAREQRVGRVRARLSRLAQQIRKTDAAKPATVANADQPQVMAQFGGFGGGMNQQGMGGGFAGQGFGGAAGNQAPVNDDNGEDLANVIQKTIAPSTWQANGGLGSIYYWRTGRAMVIRQTEEAHEGIVDLIDQLHRAN